MASKDCTRSERNASWMIVCIFILCLLNILFHQPYDELLVTNTAPAPPLGLREELLPENCTTSNSILAYEYGRQRELEYFIPPTPDESVQSTVSLAINASLDDPHNPLHNCSVTNQVRLEVTASGHWLLHSLHNGHPKKIGGDEFYVTYRDYADPLYSIPIQASPTAVAKVTDLGNGSYYLEFVEPPMRSMSFVPPDIGRSFEPFGKGLLTVHFVYTCSIGTWWDFKSKLRWRYSGASQRSYSQHLVPFPSRISHFQFPPLRDQSGIGINLGKYDHVICYGDSVHRMFCGFQSRTDCDGRFHKQNVVPFPHSMTQIATGRFGQMYIDKFRASVQESFGGVRNGSTAVLLASSAWDILVQQVYEGVPDFQDHIEALRMILTQIQQEYPDFDIYWKSPQAIHAHVLTKLCFTDKSCQSRVRFISNQYVQALHTLQEALMMELGIPFIDVLEASFLSAEWHGEGDAIHYGYKFNRALMNMTYPKNYPESDWDCTSNSSKRIVSQ